MKQDQAVAEEGRVQLLQQIVLQRDLENKEREEKVITKKVKKQQQKHE